ncbi:hypothetical protein ACSFA8_18200 [Variovorax sp. RT4R15]|uniref:hypothetical protein n=1 Tax=Variovorax sp. RT4R15 TaxID=3443737 RepID=UPI003F47C32C
MGQPSVTIFVDNVGTPHTFIRLDDGNGVSQYYGFAPASAGSAHGAGTVGQGLTTHTRGDPNNSAAGYMDDVGWSKTIATSTAQYDAMVGAVSTWRDANHTYDGIATLGGENCTTFVKAILQAGNVPNPGNASAVLPINLIPADERSALWVTDMDGRRSQSDVLRDPLHTPGTPAYEYKQAHPEMFVPPAGGSGTQDQNTSDLHWNADGTYTQEIAQIGAQEGDSERIQVTAEGRVLQVTQTDGAHNNADYNSRTTIYDAQGRIDSVDTRYDNGTRLLVDNDQDGSQAFNQIHHAYDAQGREGNYTAFYDNGTRLEVDIDELGNQNWNSVHHAFDSQGREGNFTIFHDSGTRLEVDLDETGANPWSNVHHAFDSQGREGNFTIFHDSGTRLEVDLDETGANPWSSVHHAFDSQGREGNFTIFNDSGTRLEVDLDETGANPWSSVHHAFDSQGREGNFTIFHDSGTRLEVDLDETGANPWSSVHHAFDAQGRADNATVFLDGGGRTWYDYDQTNVRGDSTWSNHLDAAGREDWANITLDDGSRDWYDYDQDGSQGWNRVVSHYDAAGREDYATMFLDDGSRNTYDYDQNGSQRWSRMESHFGANGRAEYSTTYNDDGSRLVIDHDYNGHFGEHGITTYSAAGRSHFVGWTKDGYDGLIFPVAGGVIGANGYASGPPSFGQFPAALPYLPAIYSDPDGNGPSWTIETPWGVYHGT